ncbi:MAG: tRNA (guanosine(37)-N1)-methyltransferase TrmD, partial [Gammaproteobacteria bacterium]|nr:tRNA (guanosine(37)-N1)-methyltransferase TrmD [Gammaproteobacteria bacterium]
AVLLSGNHGEIRRWRLMQALGRTSERRPELLAGLKLDRRQSELLKAYRRGKNFQSERGDD